MTRLAALFSLVLGRVVSQPGILGLRFALLDGLPLALFSYGVVIDGVYAGAWRDYGFLAAAIATLAFVTTTFPRWTAGRVDHEQAKRHPAPKPEEPPAAPKPPPAPVIVRVAGPAKGPEPHCLHCGRASAKLAFCPHCGVERASTYGCVTCPDVAITVPRHLLAHGEVGPLHCPSCARALTTWAARDDEPG